MIRNKIWILVLLMFNILLFNSCRKETDIDDTTNIEYPTEIYQSTSIKGTVKDAKGQVLEGANVQIGSITVNTDFNGYFYFDQVSAKKSGDIIKFYKSGLKTVYKTFIPQPGNTLYFEVTMYSEDAKMVINTNDENVQIKENNSVISLANKKFAIGNTSFTGNINVEKHLVSEMDDDFYQEQIGDPIGYDQYFKTKGIQIFGIAGLDLYDESNQKVELDSDNTMLIKIYVDDIQNPSSTSVWKFNYDKNKWLETKIKAMLLSENNRNYYIAEVTELGTYCIGEKYNVEERVLNISSDQNNELQFAKTTIDNPTLNYKNLHYLSSAGTLITYLPLDNNTITVNYNDQTFTNTKIEDKIVLPVKNEKINIKGKLFDYLGKALTNGYITFWINGNPVFYFPDQNGNFNCDIVFPKIDGKIQWLASDPINQKNTLVHNITKSSTINLDEIYVAKEPFVIVEFGNESNLLQTGYIDVFSNNYTLVYSNVNIYLELYMSNITNAGNYSFDNITPTITVNGDQGKRFKFDPNSTPSAYISEFDKNGYLRGRILGKGIKYDGTVTDKFKISFSTELN